MDAIEPAPLAISKRLQRAKSVTEVPLDTERPQLRARSTSLHSQASGKVPDVILPPLPLDIARIKDEVKRQSQLRHAPSKTSISSFGSTDTSILNPRPSPIIMQSSNMRAPKITKREWKNNTLEKMNPVIESRESMYSLHGSMKSSAADIETASPEARREFMAALISEDEKSSSEKMIETKAIALSFPSHRSLPVPPTSETFAPELSFTATSLKASLTPSSPSLHLVNYDQNFVVSPADRVLPELSDREQNRLSTGSVFSLSSFPLPLSIVEPEDDTVIHVPNHSFAPETPYLQQYPFRTAPCSPRPAHTSLPTLTLNFTDMPRLTPGLPPTPVRSSIQQLRRMNSDASDARKEKAGRGERRYLRLGRESSVQLPEDESWLDELDEYEAEGVELDDDEVRRLVGSVLEDWDDEADDTYDAYENAVLDLDTTPRAAQALGGARGVYADDTISGADQSTSSIWDESDAFWSSSTPPLQQSRFQPSPKPAKKRHFQVAKDPSPQESPVLGNPKNSAKARRSCEQRSERKRSALGDGTPNVGARAHLSPSTTTPGSYYDEQGFLRA
ncbi:hypothetical protein N0V95_005146 [Ascochyta clinopodiicola]|nr:hypothetical protein N0V95_005146 [Ascochyta clinopodiicola]